MSPQPADRVESLKGDRWKRCILEFRCVCVSVSVHSDRNPNKPGQVSLQLPTPVLLQASLWTMERVQSQSTEAPTTLSVGDPSPSRLFCVIVRALRSVGPHRLTSERWLTASNSWDPATPSSGGPAPGGARNTLLTLPGVSIPRHKIRTMMPPPRAVVSTGCQPQYLANQQSLVLRACCVSHPCTQFYPKAGSLQLCWLLLAWAEGA